MFKKTYNLSPARPLYFNKKGDSSTPKIVLKNQCYRGLTETWYQKYIFVKEDYKNSSYSFFFLVWKRFYPSENFLYGNVVINNTVMKSNVVCNEIELNVVNCRSGMEIKVSKKRKKKKVKEKMVDTIEEIWY